MKKVVAIPSMAPGGLSAPVSAHFGHCDMFTLVDVSDGSIGDVKVMPNGGHEQGGCMAPVMLLKQLGADALIAGGMGMRPLMGFSQVGIEVYHNAGIDQVGKAVEAFAAGKLTQFGQDMTCGGHSGGCGSH